MKRFTLDTNCIIDLEESRPNKEYLVTLIEAWRAGYIQLSVVAVTASENQPGGKINETYAQFEEKISSAGLLGVDQLLPLAFWDVFYWGHALWSDEVMVVLETKIRNILFPDFPSYELKEEKELRLWRNKLCDVLIAWCVVFHGWDVLVTSDRNFHKKAEELSDLGIKVLSPEDAAVFVGAKFFDIEENKTRVGPISEA